MPRGRPAGEPQGLRHKWSAPWGEATCSKCGARRLKTLGSEKQWFFGGWQKLNKLCVEEHVASKKKKSPTEAVETLGTPLVTKPTPLEIRVTAQNYEGRSPLFMTMEGGEFSNERPNDLIEGNWRVTVGGTLVIINFAKPEKRTVVVSVADVINAVAGRLF